MIKILVTKEQKRKYYEYELYILESLMKDEHSEFDNDYYGRKTRYIKNRLYELEHN